MIVIMSRGMDDWMEDRVVVVGEGGGMMIMRMDGGSICKGECCSYVIYRHMFGF